METGRSHDPFPRLGKVKTFSRHLSSTRPTSTSQNQLRYLLYNNSILIGWLTSRAGLAHGRDEAMRLVADAIELLPGGGLGSRYTHSVYSGDVMWCHCSSVLTHCVVGKGQSSSRVVRGVLVDVQSDMTSTITSQQLCVAVSVCDMCTVCVINYFTKGHWWWLHSDLYAPWTIQNTDITWPTVQASDSIWLADAMCYSIGEGTVM